MVKEDVSFGEIMGYNKIIWKGKIPPLMEFQFLKE